MRNVGKGEGASLPGSKKEKHYVRDGPKPLGGMSNKNFQKKRRGVKKGGRGKSGDEINLVNAAWGKEPSTGGWRKKGFSGAGELFKKKKHKGRKKEKRLASEKGQSC